MKHFVRNPENCKFAPRSMSQKYVVVLTECVRYSFVIIVHCTSLSMSVPFKLKASATKVQLKLNPHIWGNLQQFLY